MAKSADSDDDRTRSPIQLPAPGLSDGGDQTGVTQHARTRYRQRGDDTAAVAMYGGEGR